MSRRNLGSLRFRILSPSLPLRASFATGVGSILKLAMIPGGQGAIDALENQITDARRSRDDFVGVLANILLYVTNAAKNPGEAKFRRVRASNKAFQVADPFLRRATLHAGDSSHPLPPLRAPSIDRGLASYEADDARGLP